MKVLFVTPYLPYSTVPHAGGAYIYRLIVELTQRNHRISLLSFVTDEETTHVAEMERICDQVSVVQINLKSRNSPRLLLRHLLHPAGFHAWDPNFDKRLEHILASEQPDVVELYWTEMGQYLGTWTHTTPTLVCAIDVLAQTIERTFQRESMLARKLWLYWYWKQAERFEKRVYSSVSHVHTLSQKDCRNIQQNVCKAKVSVLYLGVDETLLQIPLASKRSRDILFIGNMQRSMNVDAVLWFYRDVFPLVRREVSDVRFLIVGTSPVYEIRALASDPQVIVTGRVEQLEDYYAKCRLSIVPLFVGGGIIKKAVDSLAAGCPVVATTIGVEGIDVANEREVLIADDACTFALAVNRVLTDDSLWLKLANAGRALIEQKYNWNATITDLETIYGQLAYQAKKRD